MSYYYVVPKKPGAIPEIPDVPADIEWIGQPHTDGTYLIRTEKPLPAGHSGQERKPITELSTECGKRGLLASDVMDIWRM
jgi:hypothetical protein